MTDGWQTRKLDDICEIARGGSPRPIKSYITENDDGVNWIKISDATASNKYIYTTKQKIKPEGIQRSRLVHEGDFLLSNSMSFGRPYIMKTSGCIHDGWLVLSDNSGLFDQDYLYYFLGSPAAYSQFDARAAGSTVRNLNIDLVRSVEVPLPPLPEQKRIVAILDEAFEGIDAAIANTQKNLSNARELFESYLNDVFTKKGEGWCTAPLSEVLEKITYGFTNPMPSVEKGPYLITAKNVNHGRIVYETARHTSQEAFDDLLTDKSRPRLGDVLLTKDGTLGRTAVVDQEFICVNQSVAVLRPNSEIISCFLNWLLSSYNYQKKMIKDAGGTTIKHIYITRVDKMLISYPLVDKQVQIVSQIDAINENTLLLLKNNQQKLDSLNELKQALLAKAFSGELTEGSEQVLKEAVG